jgi:hypothetical protein
MSEQEFGHRMEQLTRGMERMETLHRTLMKDGTDYGTVQGIDKPFLQQPGAEKLALFYNLVPTHIVEVTAGDGITSPPLSVVVRCRLHVQSEEGPVVGEGLGAANSWEKKHRWRFAELTCPSCGCATILKSRKEGEGYFCWAKKGGCGATFPPGDPAIEQQERGMIENPDPWDLQNTLVKMARKRAFVDATKGTTGTSALYSQDPEEVEAQQASAPAPSPRNTHSSGGEQRSRNGGGSQRNGRSRQAPPPNPEKELSDAMNALTAEWDRQELGDRAGMNDYGKRVLGRPLTPRSDLEGRAADIRTVLEDLQRRPKALQALCIASQEAGFDTNSAEGALQHRLWLSEMLGVDVPSRNLYTAGECDFARRGLQKQAGRAAEGADPNDSGYGSNPDDHGIPTIHDDPFQDE